MSTVPQWIRPPLALPFSPRFSVPLEPIMAASRGFTSVDHVVARQGHAQRDQLGHDASLLSLAGALSATCSASAWQAASRSNIPGMWCTAKPRLTFAMMK
jgi:hypothetical protein